MRKQVLSRALIRPEPEGDLGQAPLSTEKKTNIDKYNCCHHGGRLPQGALVPGERGLGVTMRDCYQPPLTLHPPS